MTRLRVAGVGAGYFSQFHLQGWRAIPEVELVGWCDRDVARVKGVAAYGSVEEMIDNAKPDLVDIVTPPDTHRELVSATAAHGLPVICQKPLAPTYAEAVEVVERAERAGVPLIVHENFRWQPWYRAIKDVQVRGDIGDFTHIHFLMRMGDGWGEDAYLARQPFFREYPRLLIYETGVHFIDTFRFLLGDVATVVAETKQLNPAIRGEDAGQVLLKFRNGSTAIWDASRYNESEAANPRFTFGELRIDGTRGHLTMDLSSTIRVKRLGQPAVELDYPRERKNFAGDCVFFLQRHFVDCMVSGEEFESSGSDYLSNVRIVDAAYESARTGSSVRVA